MVRILHIFWLGLLNGMEGYLLFKKFSQFSIISEVPKNRKFRKVMLSIMSIRRVKCLFNLTHRIDLILKTYLSYKRNLKKSSQNTIFTLSYIDMEQRWVIAITIGIFKIETIEQSIGR